MPGSGGASRKGWRPRFQGPAAGINPAGHGDAMPTRDIKESCRTSLSLAKISHGAERLFWRLTTYADDFGRMPADAGVVRGQCFSAMLDAVREKDVSGWMTELEAADLVRSYMTDDGKTFAFFPTWARHQRVRAKHSKYPAPTSAGIRGHMPANAPEVPSSAVDTEVPPKKPKNPITPLVRSADHTPEGFGSFYLAYPKHEGRAEAAKAWKKVNPDAATVTAMLKAIDAQRNGRKWREGFIPMPATWLNQRRWEDEVEVASPLSAKTAGNVQAVKNVLANLRGETDAR